MEGQEPKVKQLYHKDETEQKTKVEVFGNEYILTETPDYYVIHINRFSGEVGNRETTEIPKAIGKAMATAILEANPPVHDWMALHRPFGKTLGQKFFDSPEFQEAWARWVRRN